MKFNVKDGLLVLAGLKEIETVETKPMSNVKKGKGKERERPIDNRDLYWSIFRTDPLVGACIEFTKSFIIGAGLKVTLVDLDGNEVVVPEFNDIIRRSKTRTITSMFILDALVDGTGYFEKLMSKDGNEINKFNVVPARTMVVYRDQKGEIEKYVQELGDSEDDYVEFKPSEIVAYRNRALSGSAYGRSDVEPVTEASEILRDMTIDLANFISTKAYAPIVWKLGTSEMPWSKPEVDAWAADREDVEPGDQISVQGDVSSEVVGVGDNAFDVRPYLTFFASMVVSGLRVPATLTSVITDIGQFTADSQSNAYARRINDIRTELSELLEVELFDYIVKYNGYGDNLRSKVEWLRHDNESVRLEVNNAVQLVQNSIISPEEARMKLNYDQEVLGMLRNAIDNPEGAEPAINPESDDNKIVDTNEDDGRATQDRKTVVEDD